MTVIRNFGMAGVGSTLEFGKRGGTLNYDDATKVFSFALSSALTIPSGNNAQRPTTSTLGMLRVNTQSTPVLEMYNGTGWVTVGSGGGGTGSGSVTSVSIVSANGFTGTVANSNTTPEITLRTTVEGLIKGSSGTLIAASTTTDYQVPILLTTIGTGGSAQFDGKTLNIPTPATGVMQIIAGTNVEIESTGPDGTGSVTIKVPSVSSSNLAGGAANQIPFQVSTGTTAFSSKFTWNDTQNTLGLGDYGVTTNIVGLNASTSFPAASLLIRGGNASSLAAPGSVTISGGTGAGAAFKGGNLILQGGQGGAAGSGDIIIRTSASGALIDRVRFLASGAWSVGNGDIFTGQEGQVLTSQGSTQPPVWLPAPSASGITQVLPGIGIAVSQTGTVVTISATGAGGSSTPGGDTGQLQYNNAGVLTGTQQIVYTSSDTLTIGAANSTFTITGLAGSSVRGTNVLIKSGDQIAGGTDTRITIAGGRSQASNVNGGSVFIEGGLGSNLGTSTGGSIRLRTTTATTYADRLIITPSGAFGINGPNYGSTGQVLTSQGSSSPPIWMAAGGGGGGGSGVTIVNVSGGETGLTTFGGPITNSGTITISGTLLVSHGGTGLSYLPGETGSIFFNNNNTFAEIIGLKYDGSTKLSFNGLNITSDDNFAAFTPTNPINIKPGTSYNNTGFSANVNISGGDNFSTINKAGNAVISGGINPTASRSGSVILQTNNTDQLVISPTGAYGVPQVGGGISYGAAGQVLTSQGSNNPPVWQSFGGGTGTSGVIAVTASSPLSSTGGNNPNISLGTVPASLGGTGYVSYTFGDLLWANGAQSLAKLNIGGPGQILAVVNGRPQWSSAEGGVVSFSGGNTGLTPATATTGVITLAGRLNISFGGTNATNKEAAFNNLSPTEFSGDLIYRNATTNIRLPIGPDGTLLASLGGVPTWSQLATLPLQTPNAGRFLTTNGQTATWSNLLSTTSTPSSMESITLRAADGQIIEGSPKTGGNVDIIAGNPAFGSLGNGSIRLYLGAPGNTLFSIIKRQGPLETGTTDLFSVTNFGSIGLGGANYGTDNQVLTSRGANLPPTWKDPGTGIPTQTGNQGKYLFTNGTSASWQLVPENVSKIVAGNNNIIVSPSTGTGVVTLSVVGSGFEGVTSFSAGTTGFSPSSATTGPIVLTGTLLTTSGGTGLNTYNTGDIIYASAFNTLARLPIAAGGRVLMSGGTVPIWGEITGLPAQNSGLKGYFLSTDGSGASWNSQIYWSGGSGTNPLASRSINIEGSNGLASGAGSAGGNVSIKAGSTTGGGSGGGIVTIQLGPDPTAGYFNVRGQATEFFRITRFGSWSLGSSGENTGGLGQVLTSTGPNTPPEWTSAGVGLPDQAGYDGFFLTTNGTTASWVAVTGGTGAPGGSTGQLQFNNGGAFAGTSQVFFNGSNTITFGNGNTFNLFGANSADSNLQPGANILIRGGQSGATSVNGLTAAAGNVTIQGGSGKLPPSEGYGGNVIINAGTAQTLGGYVSIGTGATTTERIRFAANGSWLVNGQTGNNGDILVSSGNASSPTWKTIATVNGIIAGTNTTITSTGPNGTGVVTINASAAPLSSATTATLGGIKIGDGLSITSDGTVSVVGGGGGGAVSSVSAGSGLTTTTTTGNVIISGSTATTSTLGVIKVGSGLSVTADGTLIAAPPPEKFELAFAATGKVGNGTIFLYTTIRAFSIPAGMTGSRNVALSPATANTTMQIYRLAANGVINNIGLILFSLGQGSGTITFASTVNFASGDTIYMSIASADTTLGDVALTINATLI